MDIAIWFGIMLLFLFLEAGTVGLVSIWFAVGSLVALIAAALGADLVVQIVLAVVVSALCLAAVRPVVRKYITPKLVRTNVEAVIGQSAVVTEQIDNLHATGAVKLGAVIWTARSTEDKTIPAGATVRVDRVEGVKLFVTLTGVPASKV